MRRIIIHDIPILTTGRKALCLFLLSILAGQLSLAFELRVGQAWAMEDLRDPQHHFRYETRHYHPSYVLGLGFDVARLSPSTGLTANLYFIQKGISGEFIIRAASGNILDRSWVIGYGNYLSLSTPLKIESRQRHWGIYALLGPRLDYQISRHIEPLGISPTMSEETVYADGFRRFDPGLDYGMGLMLGWFSIEYRYSQNLSASFKSDIIRITNYAHQLNFVFTLAGG